jgi:hypothetical protein
MKNILLIIFALLSINAYSQSPCAGLPTSGTDKRYARKACIDSVMNRSVVNTLIADTTRVTELTITNLTDGMLKSVSGVITPATVSDYQAPLTNPVTGTMTSGQVAYANGTSTVTSEAAFAYSAVNDELSVSRLTLGANISATNWTTSGIKLKLSPIRITNTTSSGTVSAIYINLFGGDTIYATNVTTFTESFGSVFRRPVTTGGSNVTLSNSYAFMCADPVKFQSSVFQTGGQYYFNGTTAIIGTNSNHSVTIQSNGSTRINLLGNGLVGIGSTAPTPTSDLHVGGSFALPYAAKTTTYPITSSDYAIDCTSGTFTVTLPTAVGITGRLYIIKNSGAGTITVATTSSQTIDGVTTKTLSVQYGGIEVQSNGSNWIVLRTF